ncbi:MAG: isochorismatase family protein [Planctomycetota bacterium]
MSSSSEGLRSPELLHRASSRLLIVDVQEKLVAALAASSRERLVANCRFLVEGAGLFGVPVTATEQYPQGLGPTVAALAELISERPSKKRFSAVECTGWPTAANAIDDRFQIVVAGMESHVCVLQTVLDLLAAGYQTTVVADAIAARGDLDHPFALERMANSGATITTAEAVLFEWCESAAAPEFKQLSALVKARAV